MEQENCIDDCDQAQPPKKLKMFESQKNKVLVSVELLQKINDCCQRVGQLRREYKNVLNGTCESFRRGAKFFEEAENWDKVWSQPPKGVPSAIFNKDIHIALMKNMEEAKENLAKEQNLLKSLGEEVCSVLYEDFEPTESEDKSENESESEEFQEDEENGSESESDQSEADSEEMDE